MTAPVAVALLARQETRRRLVLAATGIATLVAPLVLAVAVVAAGAPPGAAPSPAAFADIPPDALAPYQAAGADREIDWAVLAAMGKLECDHGRSALPGCLTDTINPAGARGYMQFLGSTWRRTLGVDELEPRTSPPAADGEGYATDGDDDGHADPWSWPDATAAAARYLHHLGAVGDLAAAIAGYNPDPAYVEQVLAIADTYRAVDADQTNRYAGEPGNVPLVIVDGITVHTQLGQQLTDLLAAARADGLSLGGSGYRGAAEQVALRRAHCGTSDHAIYEMSPANCSPPTARPGTSLHERGLAIDFTCAGTLLRRGDACFAWLTEHAADHRLYNLPSEPWHWSTTGD